MAEEAAQVGNRKLITSLASSNIASSKNTSNGKEERKECDEDEDIDECGGNLVAAIEV
jgi:hypothetical protein